MPVTGSTSSTPSNPETSSPGDELTVDYRHLLPEGEPEAFRDAATGREIIGFSWAESLASSTRALAALQAA